MSHPHQIGPYTILHELGRGGMGVVYRARHPTVPRDVALKVLLASSSTSFERFRREGEALAAIRHPNVVRVHDAGRVEGRLYLALELVEGGRDLRGWVGRGDPTQVAELVAQVADGVGAAHRVAFVHRDLKPSNVLIDPQGRPKVTDFGTAWSEVEQQRLTASDAWVGTPHYMAPELLHGATATPACDVWSLGVLLFQLWTGQLPFVAETVQAFVVRVTDAPPPSLRRLAPGVSPALASVCLRALAKAPEDRYPHADAMAEALRGALRGVADVPARPWWRVLRAFVVGGVLGLSGVGWYASRPKAEAEGPQELEEPEAGADEVAASPAVVALEGDEEGAWERFEGDLGVDRQVRGRLRYRLGEHALRTGALRAAAWWFEGARGWAPDAPERAPALRAAEAAYWDAARWEAGDAEAGERLAAETDAAWAWRALGGWRGPTRARSAVWDSTLLRPTGLEGLALLVVELKVAALAPERAPDVGLLSRLSSEREQVFARAEAWATEGPDVTNLDGWLLQPTTIFGVLRAWFADPRTPIDQGFTESVWARYLSVASRSEAWSAEARSAWERELVVRLEVAAERLDDSARARKHLAHLRGILAEHWRVRGRTDEALEVARQAAREEPFALELATRLLAERAQAGDLEARAECRALVEGLLEQDSALSVRDLWSSARSVERAARLVHEDRDLLGALALLDRALERGVDDVRLALLGVAWAGRTEGVDRWVERALELLGRIQTSTVLQRFGRLNPVDARALAVRLERVRGGDPAAVARVADDALVDLGLEPSTR